MSPNAVLWTLVLAASGVAVFAVFYGDEEGWGAGLTLGLSLGAYGVAAIAYVLYESARKHRRRAQTPTAAATLGLVPESAGGSRLPGLPAFHLLSQGLGRSADNVMSGEVGDGRVWVFDYTFYKQSTSYSSTTGTTTSRQDYYFSCAVAELADSFPGVRIEHEGFFSRMARGLGFEDVELGDPRFDRNFKVKATNPEAARALLQPPLQQWLLTAAGDHEFELSGRWLLAYAKQRDLDELRPLLDAAVGLRDQLPRGVLGPATEPSS